MGHDEKTIAIYRHHWFAYASVFFVAVFAVTVIFGLIAAFISQGGDGNIVAQYKDSVVAGTLVFAVIILLFSLIPIWLRSQEKLILSDDSLYQTLQPSLFAGKVSQLNLAHMADVTVRNDFFGTIFGFGHITIETPGEQDNFEYYVLGNAHEAAREILEAHENYVAALESGRIPTTFKGIPAHRTPNIDPQQYQEFLAFQQMQAQAAAQQQPAEAVAAANAQPPYQAENTQDDVNSREKQQ
jgi:hypothetical protein